MEPPFKKKRNTRLGMTIFLVLTTPVPTRDGFGESLEAPSSGGMKRTVIGYHRGPKKKTGLNRDCGTFKT